MLHLKIVLDITNAFICLFYLALLFLVSSFVVRRHGDINLIIPRAIKYYVYYEIGSKKNQSTSRKHWGFTLVFELVRKTIFEKTDNFCVIIFFCFCWI